MLQNLMYHKRAAHLKQAGSPECIVCIVVKAHLFQASDASRDEQIHSDLTLCLLLERCNLSVQAQGHFVWNPSVPNTLRPKDKSPD